MQKIIIQTTEGRKFRVCADVPEPKGNTGFVRVLGFKVDDYQDVSPTYSDEPNYILNKLAKSIPHIEIKKGNDEADIIILQRKRKPFSFQNIFSSRNRYYYESKLSSDVSVTIEEIFF